MLPLATSPTGTLTTLKIGSRIDGHPSNNMYWEGSIKNLKLYNRKLDSVEVLTNYNDKCNYLPSDRSDMVLWAWLDEGKDSISYDLSSYSETGTHQGSNLKWGRAISDSTCLSNSLCFTRSREKYESRGYLYGFNGMEKDDELSGEGNSYTSFFRQYDFRFII